MVSKKDLKGFMAMMPAFTTDDGSSIEAIPEPCVDVHVVRPQDRVEFRLVVARGGGLVRRLVCRVQSLEL